MLAAAAAWLSSAALPRPAAAEEAVLDVSVAPATSSPSKYVDPEDQFTIDVPAGWVQGSGTIGQAGTLTTNQARFSNAAGLRRVVAFVPEDKPDVSVAITIQFLGPDFTSLGSFGNVQDFAGGVVSKMDNSYILRSPEWRRKKEGPLTVAKLLDAREVDRKLYAFSYSLAREGDPVRYVYQSVAVGRVTKASATYNKFYSLSGTCSEADAERYGPVLERIVQSFRPPTASQA